MTTSCDPPFQVIKTRKNNRASPCSPLRVRALRPDFKSWYRDRAKGWQGEIVLGRSNLEGRLLSSLRAGVLFYCKPGGAETINSAILRKNACNGALGVDRGVRIKTGSASGKSKQSPRRIQARLNLQRPPLGLGRFLGNGVPVAAERDQEAGRRGGVIKGLAAVLSRR